MRTIPPSSTLRKPPMPPFTCDHMFVTVWFSVFVFHFFCEQVDAQVHGVKAGEAGEGVGDTIEKRQAGMVMPIAVEMVARVDDEEEVEWLLG